jgi:hypothetical protein
MPLFIFPLRCPYAKNYGYYVSLVGCGENKVSGEVQNIPLCERRCNVRFNTVSIVFLSKYASERS